MKRPLAYPLQTVARPSHSATDYVVKGATAKVETPSNFKAKLVNQTKNEVI